MEMPGLAASHTLKNEAFHGPPLWKIALLYKMDRWMSLQQGVSHTSMEWTDGDAWAGSFPYFREMKPSMHSQVEKMYNSHMPRPDALAPLTGFEDLTGSGLITEREDLKY